MGQKEIMRSGSRSWGRGTFSRSGRRGPSRCARASWTTWHRWIPARSPTCARVSGRSPTRASSRAGADPCALRGACGEPGGPCGAGGRRGADQARDNRLPHRRGRAGIPAGIRRPQGHVSRHAAAEALPFCAVCREADRRAAALRRADPLAHHDRAAEPPGDRGLFRVAGLVRRGTPDRADVSPGHAALPFTRGPARSWRPTAGSSSIPTATAA